MTPARGEVITVEDAARVLTRAGVPDAEHDARVLSAHAGRTGEDLAALTSRRAAREPLPHIIGSTRFRGLDLFVGPGVFVPQPETECVVEAVLHELVGTVAPLVVDLCAGSGTLGLSVAHEHPSAVVHIVEKSPDAFEWLGRNAAGLDRVHLHLDDAATALGALDGTVDVVASNPPYVAEHELGDVDPEVGGHDPAVALWAGLDGLDVIRLVERSAARLLHPGGAVVIEHSDRQGSAVPDLLRAKGWSEVEDHPDHLGRPRFATARLPFTVARP